jgi:dihydropteroate synthase
MGIVNITPDSFSTGRGGVPGTADAVDLALGQLRDGADIVDIGAESSRPGAEPLDADAEIARLGDTIRLVRARTDAPISVDTYHAETARFALEQGADIINDITALRGGWEEKDDLSTAMAELAAREGAHVILMHMPEAPRTMQSSPAYIDVLTEVKSFLLERAGRAKNAGIPESNVWLDPGFGFGKDFRHNRELLLGLGELAEYGYPIAVGLSRKRMIRDALGVAEDERLEASLSLAVIASLTGADLVRVHDVKATVRAVGMADAVRLGVTAY